jgi:flagellar hook assembly protein FlgD
LNPQDGTQFVGELAQFSSVEQELQMRTDLDNMNSIMTAAANQSNPAQSGTTGTTQP